MKTLLLFVFGISMLFIGLTILDDVLSKNNDTIVIDYPEEELFSAIENNEVKVGDTMYIYKISPDKQTVYIGFNPKHE